MRLSASERRFIARCRKAERQWPVGRWVILLVAISFWAASSYILIRLVTPGGRVGAGDAEIAFEQDVLWFMNLACAALAMFTVFRWRGDPRTTLLLKLLEAREKEDSQGAAPNGGPATRSDNSGVTDGPPSVS